MGYQYQCVLEMPGAHVTLVRLSMTSENQLLTSRKGLPLVWIDQWIFYQFFTKITDTQPFFKLVDHANADSENSEDSEDTHDLLYNRLKFEQLNSFQQNLKL